MRQMALVFSTWMVLSGAGGAVDARQTSVPRVVTIKVIKTPTCGCCAKWVEHLKAAGFAPVVQDLPSLDAVKANAGVPPALRSCHTAFVGGYVVEGHVPADLIRKLLDEKPAVAGLAVAGMPAGSPGMEQGDVRQPYEVLTFTRDGHTTVYAQR